MACQSIARESGPKIHGFLLDSVSVRSNGFGAGAENTDSDVSDYLLVVLLSSNLQKT
jgi:hypothetical protein